MELRELGFVARPAPRRVVVLLRSPRLLGAYVPSGKEERELAPDRRRALHANLSAEELRDLATDRQPESRPAVPPVRGAVRLLEGLEDELLLVLLNSDAGIGHLEGDHLGRLIETAAREAPVLLGAANRELHAATLGELERVRQQVLEDLLQALAVGVQRRRRVGVDHQVELEMLLFRDRAEGAVHEARDVGNRHFGDRHLHLSRLDLRQIQNVVDEVEEVGARGVYRARVLHLLRRERAVFVVRQQLREDQQRVQRRAQLVRHVCEELALVLGAERELLRFLLQRLARRLDLAVFLLDLGVLLREERRLFL